MKSLPSADTVEWALALILVLLALLLPQTGCALFGRFRRASSTLTGRPVVTLALVSLAPILLRLALLAWIPEPLPRVMEEHSHLLQADTYAHHRLANPPHPLAVLFQSYQEEEWPRYVSARPPLSGFFLYLGQSLLHSVFLGNLFSVGLLSGCLFWMLAGWLPQRWALFGSYLVICHFCLFGYWVNSLWAPSVTLLGATLLLGLVPRIRKGLRWRQAVLFVTGMALLLGTRPYEGVVCIATISGWLLVTSPTARRPKLLIPVVCGGLAIIAAQLYYDEATTGKITRMPYQIWRESQTTVPAFWWQPIATKPRVFYYAGAQQFQIWEQSTASGLYRSRARTLAHLVDRHATTVRDLVGPLLLLPLFCWSPYWFSRRMRSWQLMAFAVVFAALSFAVLHAGKNAAGVIVSLLALAALLARWRTQKYRLPLLLVVMGGVATSASTFYMDNYFLPFVPASILLIVVGFRNLAAWNRTSGTGASLAGFLSLGCVLMPLLLTGAAACKHPLYVASDLSHLDYPPFTGALKAEQQLAAKPGQQLVFVRGLPEAGSPTELVWNLADIDSQRIVWAHDLKPEWTAAAVKYYAGRKVWLLNTASHDHSSIVPYPLSELPAAAPLQSLPMPDRR